MQASPGKVNNRTFRLKGRKWPRIKRRKTASRRRGKEPAQAPPNKAVQKQAVPQNKWRNL